MTYFLGILFIVIVGVGWLIYRSQSGCRVPLHKVKHEALLGTWSRGDEWVTLSADYTFTFNNNQNQGQHVGEWVYDDKTADNLRIHLPDIMLSQGHLILTPIECQRTLMLQALLATEVEGELHYRPFGDAKFTQAS